MKIYMSFNTVKVKYHDKLQQQRKSLCDPKFFKVPPVDFLFLAGFNEIKFQYNKGILLPL